MQIQENVSLADKNWFRTGGNASYYAEPENSTEFQEAVNYANHNQLEIFVLGQGANILISDEGFDGLVINTIKFKKTEVLFVSEDNEVEINVTSGAVVQDLIDDCLDQNYIGLEDFSGIPGTVGGSAYINIHYFDKLLSDFVTGGTVLEKETGSIYGVDASWFEYGYDKSKLMEGKHYLLDINLKLKKVSSEEAAYAKGRSVEIIRHRHMRYPYKNTCGSFFRNFHENEVTFETNGKKIINVAYYLDKIGVKGDLKVGNAIVSHKHANMIETLDGATSTDVIELARQMQTLVKDKYDIIPQPECQLIGFKEYPLL